MKALDRVLSYKSIGTIAIVTAGNDLYPPEKTHDSPSKLQEVIDKAFELCENSGRKLKIIYGVPRSDTYKLTSGIDF